MLQRLDNYRPKKVVEETMPGPVFDEFLQAFIVTKYDKSFYIDLDGNFSTEFRTIKWPQKVLKLQLARPYLVALMANNQWQVRNMLNPLSIMQDDNLVPCIYQTSCVSANLTARHQNRLDDFYLVIR